MYQKEILMIYGANKALKNWISNLKEKVEIIDQKCLFLYNFSILEDNKSLTLEEDKYVENVKVLVIKVVL